MTSFKDKFNKWQYQALKARIKGIAAAGSAIRKEANRNRGTIRYVLRNHKREIGQEARYLLLVLGFLKGRKYDEIEPKRNKRASIVQLRKVVQRYCWQYNREQLERDLMQFLNLDGTKEQAA
jgi:hypothetical protein